MKSWVRYSPRTGLFIWAHRKWKDGRPSWRNGKVAGSINKHSGYVELKVAKRTALGHMWAWFYMTGKWPAFEIDHRNGIKSDNRWKNIRRASRTENCWNVAKRKDNSSGHKGVGFDKQKSKWRARITSHKTTVWLGYFETAAAAGRAYRKAASAAHGRFATHVSRPAK